jgi:deazaflavin-dependent oxidoreductase (nitroreductase family)
MEEYNRRLIEEFRAGRLEPGGPLEGRPMLLLTTTGAKTGRRHTMPLMYVLDGGRLLVIASNAGAPRHPDWYRNLSADPGVTVEVGAETYEATAAELEGEERERVWGRSWRRTPSLRSTRRRRLPAEFRWSPWNRSRAEDQKSLAAGTAD